MKIKTSKISEDLIFILTVVLVSSFYILDTYRYISLILLSITLIIWVIDIIQNNRMIKLKIDVFQYLLGIFGLFCLISSLWAAYPNQSIIKATTIFELIICYTILYSHYSKYDSVGKLIKVLIWTGVITSTYSIIYGGINNVIGSINAGVRLQLDFTNINAISGIAAISIISIIYCVMFERKKHYIILTVPCILIVFASGSRKSLVLILLGGVCFALARSYSKSKIKTFLRWCLVGVICFFVIRFLLSLPAFELLNNRMEGLISMLTGKGEADSSALERKMMIIKGIEQFKKTPILGVGIGNSGPVVMEGTRYANSYLHNNYIELLSGGGLVGFVLYYNLYFYNLWWYWKRCLHKSNERIFCIVFMLCDLIMNFGEVTYYSKGTYFKLMIFFLCTLQIKRNRRGRGEYEHY